MNWVLKVLRELHWKSIREAGLHSLKAACIMLGHSSKDNLVFVLSFDCLWPQQRNQVIKENWPWRSNKAAHNKCLLAVSVTGWDSWASRWYQGFVVQISVQDLCNRSWAEGQTSDSIKQCVPLSPADTCSTCFCKSFVVKEISTDVRLRDLTILYRGCVRVAKIFWCLHMQRRVLRLILTQQPQTRFDYCRTQKTWQWFNSNGKN